MMKKILIVAAHPDDEILGCGGTIAKLTQLGYEAYSLILGEGITSRDRHRDKEKRKKEIENLKKQIFLANKTVGIKEVFTYNYPDNRFDSVDLLDIIKTVEEVKNKIKPDIIFTHHKDDLNIDHQITYKAVVTATRPLKEESVKEIYSFEVLSSTEWNYPIKFSPNVFIDIEETLDKKLEAMKFYKSELREFPHPRSLEGIKLNAQYWGVKVGKNFVEAFQCVRIIK